MNEKSMARQALILAWCTLAAVLIAGGTLIIIGDLAIEASQNEAKDAAHLIDLNTRVKALERASNRADARK